MTFSSASRKRLRIGIDAHALGSGLGGNETYLRSLLTALRAHPEHAYVLYVSYPGAAEIATELLPGSTCHQVSSSPIRRLAVDLSRASQLHELDVMHLQYVAPLFPGCPISLLIHDLSYEHNPNWFRPLEVMRFRLTIPPSAAASKAVLTVSNFCRADIMKRLNLPANKVTVTPNALPPIYAPAGTDRISALRSRLKLPDSYILALGNLQPRKNITSLIKAWKLILDHPALQDVSLVITGKKAWLFDEIIREAGAPQAERIYFTGYLPEEDLPTLYSGAAIFVYPSLFEGFGLPPIEAMACGTPVIVGRNSALPEVCGEAVHYADVTSAQRLGEDILHLILNKSERQRFSAAGIERAGSFTLKSLSVPTINAWEEIAAAHPSHRKI